MSEYDAPVPADIIFHAKSRVLELRYADESYSLSCEYLRVYSPSAEVRGHGVGQEVLQTQKQAVSLNGIQPSGNYAVQLIFDDGHDSGIYTWKYLYKLCQEHERLWRDYLDRLEAAGASREPLFKPA